MSRNLEIKSPIAAGIVPDELLGYSAVGDDWEMVLVKGSEESVVARGWKLYSRKQRHVALRHGTILAIAHGWRTYGIHVLGGQNYIGPIEKPLMISSEPTRFERINGRPVSLHEDITNPIVDHGVMKK